MSMISAQIDELRNAARGQKVMGLFELAQMLKDAADTIWVLRDDLQRANDAVQDAEHDESMAWDRVRKAEAENDRLRELLHRLLVEYRYLRVRPRKMYLQHEARMRAIEEEMRELGIEVDE